MTRWFLDTEFNEDGRAIDLISIALVSEDGADEREWVSAEFNEAACQEWVNVNVLPNLAFKPRVKRHIIAAEIKQLLLRDGKPEIWAYFASYDWVALCQLFGRMIDLPPGFPMWCRDLKQLMSERGITKADLPPQLGAQHSALADAGWVRDSYVHIMRKK